MRNLTDYIFSTDEKQRIPKWEIDLQSAIGELPPDNKKVIQLHFIENVSRKEVAQKLGWSLSKVNTKLTRGISLLRWHCNPAAFEDAKLLFKRHLEKIVSEKIV